MDRRTFLAFGLIFLILIGSQMILQKFYGRDPLPAAADSTAAPLGALDARPAEWPLPATAPTTAAPGEAGPTTVTSTAQALTLIAGGPERRIVVTTPLYRLAISTDGGRIVSWEALEHGSHLGGPVQLVAESIPPHGLDAVLFRGEILDLGAALYDSDAAAELAVAADQGPRSLVLKVRTAGGLEARKTFTFDPAVYGFRVDCVLAAADDDAAARQSLALLGPPEEFRFGWNQGILPTERVQRMELPALRSLARIGEDFHYKKRTDLQKNVEKAQGMWRGSVHFAGLQSRYFTILGVVPQEPGRPVEGTIRLDGDPATATQSWAIDVPARRGLGPEIAGAGLDLYIGPQQAELLAPYGQNLDKTMDLGWKWVRPLSVGVLWCLEWMHRYVPNYGLIIILFSVLTKLLFYPLTKTSTESMKKMQELQPKLKALQAKYKDDKEKLNQATMKLYQEEKVNPLAGCLPLLLQSPVFIALYQALNHTISLRGQPFALWITDLSQPDALATLPFALPFLGSDLNVLPILMAVAMYFQTKMTPTTGGGQMAMMNTMMPLFMVFIFYNMPSGLVLYWLVNTVMQGYQSWRIHKTATADGGAQST